MLSESGAYPIENFIRVLNINLVGTFNVLRLAAERIAALDLSADERGVIINTASVAAFDGQIGRGGLRRIQGRRGRYDVAHRPRLGPTAGPRSDNRARTLRDADHGAVNE